MGKSLNKSALILLLLLGAIVVFAQGPGPLTLVKEISMPEVPVGPYTDHLAVDVKGHRLFATPQAHKSVQVFDLATGKLLRDITGFENPHSILYRPDVDQIYVTDGGAGQLKIFSGSDYRLVKSVKRLPDADSIGYDPATKYLYVTNGGEGAHLDHSLLSIIDTTTGEHLGDIKVSAESLEAMAVADSGSRLYIDVTDKNEVAVIDLRKREVIETWPVTKGKKNIAITLDEAHHRLFVGCRDTETSGVIAVFDTQTGKEIESLPIAGWVDYMAFDTAKGRIYATCGSGPDGGGWVYIYEQSGGLYRLAGKVASAPRGKTGLFVPEMNRFFVSVPHFGNTSAQILAFQIR